MKRCVLFLSFWLLATYSFAQNQIAVKVSPGLAFSRVYTDPDTAYFASDGMSLRGKLAVMYDIFLKENYYLSTGACFVAKQVAIKNDKLSIKEHHEIQYLQLPIVLKLYTSEIELDLRAYIEIGLTGALKINNRVTKLTGTNQLINKLRMWEIGGLFSCGLEYKLGLFTSGFISISYQPGLSSMFLQQADSSTPYKLFGYADLFTIDLGIVFY